MAAAQETGGTQTIAFEAYGVRASVEAGSAEILERIRPLLPPGWQPCSPEDVEQRYELVTEDVGTYTYKLGGVSFHNGLELELALEILESQIRLNIGTKAPDTIFIHAGVVAHRGRTIVLPGTSFAGKTTLVAALVRAGAVYFSDEFAVIDAEGLIHPYPKPLSLRRDGERKQTDHSVESLGGTRGETALPVGAVVVTSYRAGAEWRPERLSPGEGAMVLLANAVPARERPAQVMSAISHAVEGAVIIRSDRDDAAEIAPLLLAEVERLAG